MFLPIKREGVDKLHELRSEAEFEQDPNKLIRIRNVIATFPVELIAISGYYDGNSNEGHQGLSHTLLRWDEWRDISALTSKELQVILKNALNKIEPLK